MKKNHSSPESFILLTGLAQKINAPLKSLLLSSQKLLDTYKSKNFEYISYKDFKYMLVTLEQMNKQINRCYETTQRMVRLDKSKMNQEVCNINEVIKDIVELLQHQMSINKIKYQIRLKKDIPGVMLSRIDGHQVVHNVLTNAMQAMPAGGTVKIRTSLDVKSQRVIVDVVDEGVGINSQHLSKIFEPFFTTKDHGVEKSSGLGLSVVHAIVQAVGGSIDVQSSLRKGTQVRIFLPVASAI
jgi:signal transduction histidine kinase